MDKIKLREKLKDIRASVSEKAKKNTAIRESLFLFLEQNFPKEKDIFIYESFGSEVDTWAIIDEALALGYRILTPKVDKEFNMTAVCRFTGESVQKTPAIIIVPLLGFNKNLDRIGYGKGCYDKYFIANPHNVKIGLAYMEQHCIFESEPHDISLDFIITPMIIFKGAGNSR